MAAAARRAREQLDGPASGAEGIRERVPVEGGARGAAAGTPRPPDDDVGTRRLVARSSVPTGDAPGPAPAFPAAPAGKAPRPPAVGPLLPAPPGGPRPPVPADGAGQGDLEGTRYPPESFRTPAVRAPWHSTWRDLADDAGAWARRHRSHAAATLAVVAVLVVAGVAAALSMGSRPAPSPHASAGHRVAPSTATAPGGGTGSSPTSAPASAPTTAPSTPGSPGGPRIASASPSSGAAGSSVVVSGTGFFSPDGVVTAFVGGHPAGTSCGSQTSCTLTVPDIGPGPASVTLTIVTSGGTSNGVPFGYT